jgi:hypothetical protein
MENPSKEKNKKEHLVIAAVTFKPSPDGEERLQRCYAILLRRPSDESSKSTTDVDYIEQPRRHLNGS